jgi:hypothetical protein
MNARRPHPTEEFDVLIRKAVNHIRHWPPIHIRFSDEELLADAQAAICEAMPETQNEAKQCLTAWKNRVNRAAYAAKRETHYDPSIMERM